MTDRGEAPARGKVDIDAIVVGASAGAVEALLTLLPSLHASFPLPIMIVVHLPPDRKSSLAELFQQRCQVRVKEAEDKEPIERGTVYLAPPNYHLLIEADRELSLSSEEPVRYSRPSIDVLFQSAADAYGEKLIGIVLTGANNDGAEGLRAICEAGGMGIVQEPDTAQVPTMPLAALAECSKAQRMDLEAISICLERLQTAPGT